MVGAFGGCCVTLGDLSRADGVELGVCELACVRHHPHRLFVVFSLSLTWLFVVTSPRHRLNG